MSFFRLEASYTSIQVNGGGGLRLKKFWTLYSSKCGQRTCNVTLNLLPRIVENFLVILHPISVSFLSVSRDLCFLPQSTYFIIPFFLPSYISNLFIYFISFFIFCSSLCLHVLSFVPFLSLYLCNSFSVLFFLYLFFRFLFCNFACGSVWV
jgi:hypothetical protein